MNRHAHHWRIEEPAGPFSLGVCLKCKAERMFRNFETAYENDPRAWREDRRAAAEAK